MQKVLEVFVILDNIPGAISELTRLLKKSRISIHAIGLFIDTARVYVDNPQKALDVLQKYGYNVELREVLSAVIPNRDGALMEMTQKIANAEINIKYLYGAMLDNQKRGLIILEVDKPQLALDIFENHRF